MKRFLPFLYLSFLFLLFPTFSSIQISEVIPHSNNHLGCEWVELYNPTNSTIFFNGSIGDLQSTDPVAFNLSPNSYFLIIDNDCNISDLPSNTSFLTLKAIGNGLADKSDCIFLNSSEGNDSFCWNFSIEEKGDSFCRINNTWYANCTPTPGEENKLAITPKVIDILEKPYILSFGSLGFIKGVLYKKGIETLFNKNLSRIRLLVYSPSGQGSYIVRNFDDSVIYSVEGCNSEFAIILSNFTNKTYFTIPFFITKNCDNSKKAGTYKIRIRVFDFENGTCPESNGKGKYYDIAELQIKIEGINKDLCPKEKIIYKTKKSKKRKKENKDIIITIENQTIEYPYIFSEIKLTNNRKEEVSGLLYSYLFKGRKCFSGGWRENQIFISLPPQATRKIKLNNTISEKAETGIYKFRARFLVNDKKYDSTKEIYLLIPEKKENKRKEIPSFTFKKAGTNFSINITNCIYCRILGKFNATTLLLYFYSNNSLFKKEFLVFQIPKKKIEKVPTTRESNTTENVTKKEPRNNLPSSKIPVPSIISPIFKVLSFFEYLIKSSIRNI